jgi:hypothetical protein
MPRGSKLSEYEKGRIYGFKANGVSNRQIAKAINRSANLVYVYVKNPRKYNSKLRKGRPRKLSPRDEDYKNGKPKINQLKTN